LEEEPCSINGISKNRRIPNRITKKLGGRHKVNGRGPKEYEEAIQKENKKLSRIES